jgi:hypothetical protein
MAKALSLLPQAHLPSQPGTPAQDVLQALNQFDPQMNEIDRGVSNPNAYFPIDYDMPYETTLAGVTSMIRVAQLLQSRAIAHLDNNEVDLAEADYLRSFRINRALTNGCSVVNYLAIVGVREIDNAILWEGLRRHAWTDSQLRDIESVLASEDMLDLARKAIRTERAQGLACIRFVQNQHYDLEVSLTQSENLKDTFAKVELLTFLKGRPSGWGKRELIFLSLEMQKQIDAINPGQGTLNSKRLQELEGSQNLVGMGEDQFYARGCLDDTIRQVGSPHC